MFFRKKDKLKKKYDEKLLNMIEANKKTWNTQKAILEKSLDPSEDVICKMKIEEAKYLFLLKEVRVRHNRN
ncbi:YaaL family protein [Sutcliffiella cohnii]|uniref:DUF2508 domain-containing protein n=1 Tax=Sutcliffiella cohnii TaxID=33932 RepID=A0A223KX17_9BACI|nr:MULTISPECIES: YaaL family protein [Sutcliffiella]AST93954.1 hypothetical protein BC6307_23130 [Sutcliffiella cohnii]MED4018455.1 YaaL family protein [Sutcliffiella cohnii]WBL15157.1 YaaL family protein [Sutcliffiella sp. NC1]